MSYLLDTDACVAIIRGRPRAIRDRLEAATKAQIPIWISSIVSFELWYGVHMSARHEENVQLLENLFAGVAHVLPFDGEDAMVAGEVRAYLEARGARIGAYDLLIAGQALRRGLTLVTSNVAEFRRVDRLVWEDWGAGS